MSWLHRIALVAWALLALGGARSASARGEVDVCHYTTQLGLALYSSYPQADLDGDGMLSRSEACDLQAELLRDRRDLTSRLSPAEGEELRTLLDEPLCCETQGSDLANPEADSCPNVLGAPH